MGEVGTNSADNKHADLKMNGGINGNCDDELEAMDVDAQNTSNETIAKNTENSSEPPITSTTDDSPMELDSSGNSDGVEIINSEADSKTEQDSIELISHENGATSETTAKTKETCDQNDDEHSDDLIDKNTIVCDDISSKLNDDNEATVKVLSDPLSMDAEDIEDDKRTKQNRPQSTENGTSATITSSNENDDKDIDQPKQSKQSIPIVDDEIHAISDSDDDDVQEKSVENPLKGVEDHTMDVANSNGIDIDDDDKPVSIHSDSDSDAEQSNKDEVHEILSDKEDCVVIEDDKKIDGSDLTVRSLNRNRKSAVRPREEIIEDPLEQSAPKKPRLTDPLASDSKMQTPINTNSSKEPTLVIIDTNTILSRGTAANVQALNKSNVSVTPVGGVQSQGVYPIDSRASITPVPNSAVIANATSTTLAGLNAPVLTALTDDMFVLEAPSFIVPYNYEKPPSEDLKEIVVKMAVEIDELCQLRGYGGKRLLGA